VIPSWLSSFCLLGSIAEKGNQIAEDAAKAESEAKRLAQEQAKAATEAQN
jgi:hypothetical protein